MEMQEPIGAKTVEDTDRDALIKYLTDYPQRREVEGRYVLVAVCIQAFLCVGSDMMAPQAVAKSLWLIPPLLCIEAVGLLMWFKLSDRWWMVIFKWCAVAMIFVLSMSIWIALEYIFASQRYIIKL